MDTEKFNSTISYFTDNNIPLPTDVKNAIEDVFRENDNIAEVLCYQKEDVDTFETDLTLTSEIHIHFNGNSYGSSSSVWTYYGGVEWSLSEISDFDPDNGDPLEEIMQSISDQKSHIDEEQYQVILIEKMSWDTEKKFYEKKDTLYIYCPVSDEPDDDYKYEDVYNEVKNEEYDQN